MKLTLNSWKPGTEDFVNHRVLQEYIEETSRTTQVHERTVYQTRVEEISKAESFWRLRTSTLGRKGHAQSIERIWVRSLALYPVFKAQTDTGL